MAHIKSFRIEGLAGRSETCAVELGDSANVCFGFNGSGKTSLLKILHSALSNNAEVLKHVPFTSAEVVIRSWHRGIDYVYSLDKRKSIEPEKTRANVTRLAVRPRARKISWDIEPREGGAWHHIFLPTTRLYRMLPTQSVFLGYSQHLDDAEEGLEASFVESLTSTWKDYTAKLAREAREAQEEGLARILVSFITRPDATGDEISSDPLSAYTAVSQFLARTKMSEESPSKAEFLQRYNSDFQLRNVSMDIQKIEHRIAEIIVPRDRFKSVVNKMFAGGKSLTFDETQIEVSVGDKKINLASLSSGEKHLIRILVETIAARPSPLLVDEPELSLHVDWQRRLIETMTTLNPASQMIFATHSPEIMADLPDSNIFRI
jgi:energy-coupling factor transporter ATP-binding protein EcfA2